LPPQDYIFLPGGTGTVLVSGLEGEQHLKMLALMNSEGLKKFTDRIFPDLFFAPQGYNK
jgi:hypothetical protein